TLFGIRISLPSEPPLTVFDSNIVQATRCFHDRIRYALFRVAQYVFDDSGAFHPGQIMFHFDPNPCQLPVGSLFSRGEFASAWLFFSPGRFSSLPAHTLGSRYPCTRWPPADRRSSRHRLSFSHA